MATISSLKKVYMELPAVGTSGVPFAVIFQGTPENYVSEITGITGFDFTAREATAEDTAAAHGIVTPVSALLQSGSFQRITARGGKKSRQLIIPSDKVAAVISAIKGSAPTGIDINGALCTSVSNGLKRRTI